VTQFTWSSGEDIIIREEREEDREAVRTVNEKTFGQPTEANIVDSLQKYCSALSELRYMALSASGMEYPTRHL